MSRHAGAFAEVDLIDHVSQSRVWDTNPYRLTAVNISKDGITTLVYAWHEGTLLEDEHPERCLQFQGNTLTLSAPDSSPPIHFAKIAEQSTGMEEDAPYFDLLFKGCYRDQGDHRWCFTAQNISIDGKPRKARLKLDTSELPEGGSALEVENEKLFWIFKPESDGWLVQKSSWASAKDYVEIDWTKPWVRLRAERTK